VSKKDGGGAESKHESDGCGSDGDKTAALALSSAGAAATAGVESIE
jgi:hypothetical protein